MKGIRATVFERDKGLCWLCETPCRADRQVPDPLAFTLDHVHPRGLGGGNSVDNLRAAHFMCNQVRGMWLSADLNRLREKVAQRVTAQRKKTPKPITHPPRRVPPRPTPHIDPARRTHPPAVRLVDALTDDQLAALLTVAG